jgi:mevalonate kinase
MPEIQNKALDLYAHGKLLISGEYLVLRGAKALSLPLKYGQSLQISAEKGQPSLFWKALLPDTVWFTAAYDLPYLEVKKTDNQDLAERLKSILLEAKKMNPAFLSALQNVTATSQLNFPPEWGIGSSSSLLANIGRWAGADPFELNRRIFGGSGYDIAAAMTDMPIIYQLIDGKPVYETTDFNPSFQDQLWFVYLNRKQSSKPAVQKFSETIVSQVIIDSITEITLQMSATISLDEFMTLMRQHEKITGEVLRQIPVQERLFPDFKGAVKSMGAWGGDFLLAASEHDQAYIRSYFAGKGFETVLRFKDMKL